MRRYDLAIHGFGILPALLAIHLLDRDPGQSLLLLSGNKTIGGESLEPVVTSSLSSAAATLVEPFVVRRWPGYFVTRNGTTTSRDDEVRLLDPLQIWLELQGLIETADMVTDVGPVSQDHETLTWAGGSAQVAQLVDLTALTRRDHSDEILGLELARSLPWPVLCDFDTGAEPWDAFQHIPLGDDRVYVRKRNCQGEPEADLTTGFGRLLSDLIGY